MKLTWFIAFFAVVYLTDLLGSGASLVVTGVELSDGATDGSDGYYKLGDELMIIAFPDTDAVLKLKSLVGKRVTLTLIAE